MCTEWHEHSFFLEVKPRAELASLFVDCPPDDFPKAGVDEDGNDKEYGTLLALNGLIRCHKLVRRAASGTMA